MTDVVFDEEFFKKLKEKIESFFDFFRQNWIWGTVFLGILMALILVQQILLSLIH